jgi:osmotically-inducible protein OsmY
MNPDRGAERPAEVLLVGEDDLLEEAEANLKGIMSSFRRERWGPGLPDRIDEDALAVLLVHPIPWTSPLQTVRSVRATSRGRGIPLVVLAPDTLSEARVRNLYSAGATAVFLWPREAPLLPGGLVELLGINRIQGPAKRADTALARAVRAHLRLAHPGMSQRVQVSVRDGVADLAGAIPALWQKRLVEEVVAQVPGIRGLVDDKLVVLPPKPVPARTIRRAILSLLRATTDIDESTLSVTVRNGYVTLVGTVEDRGEHQRVLGIIENVKGVRGIENLTTVSVRQKRADHVVAERLAKGLRAAFPDADVRVGVFAGVAVLGGSVGRLVTKRRMEELVARDDSVARVINKTQVRGGRKRSGRR